MAGQDLMRYFAAIGPRSNQPIRQFWAGPLKRGSRSLRKTEMGWPRILLIVHEDGPMLYRYTGAREFAGDTSHRTVEEAQAQAAFEYEDALGSWEPIPETVPIGREPDYALEKVGRAGF